MSVRVRYPPSPTGFQHIGSVRTALYNYLFSRRQGGTFVLRIEDTDRKRFVPEALQDIYDTFAWLGFHWDEGPDTGGAARPVLPVGAAGDLQGATPTSCWPEDMAYRCYCTAERLDALRKEQESAGAADPSAQGYDRHCRNLSAAERAAAEAGGHAVGHPPGNPSRGIDELHRHPPGRHHGGEQGHQPGSRC